MIKIALEKDVIVYQFEATSDSLIGCNITAVFKEKEYLLIDTGYQHNIKEILEDLKDYTCTHVINTHYHPDHTYGLYELPEVIKIGSIESKDTLIEFELENEQLLFPTILVKDNLTYTYGNHTFTMSKNIGHSKCGIIIDLDSKYLFVGDDLLMANNGDSIFPFLTLENIKHPINALNNIRIHSKDKLVIPAHGKLLETDDSICHELDIRLKYFQFIQANPSLTDFENETNIKFVGRRGWHKHNTTCIKGNE